MQGAFDYIFTLSASSVSSSSYLSDVVWKIIKKYDAETTVMLDSIAEIISMYSSKEDGELFKKSTIELVFHLLLLYKRNNISKEEFEKLSYSFRFLCSSTTNAFRYGKINDDNTLDRILNFAQKFESDLVEVLKDKEGGKVVGKVKDTVGMLGRKEFLIFARGKKDHFKVIVFTMVSYLEKLRNSEAD